MSTDWIVITPGLRGGKPHIRGTRITVSDVAGWLRAGMGAEEIVEDFPHLELNGVLTAIAYYEEHREEIDRREAEDEASLEELMRDGAWVVVEDRDSVTPRPTPSGQARSDT